MYSVILMAAMSTGTAEAPNWLLRGLFCHSSCYGGTCYGCCGGCWGGCHGGCYGGGWGGGWGGCYGACYGGSFCLGGGCYGGCWGSCNGCYGGCYGYGWGSYSYPSYTAPPAFGYPVAPGPVVPGVPAGPEKLTTPPKTTGTNGMARADNSAKIVVEVPADARLFIDDQLMRAGGERRTYMTPQLQPGQRYYYEMRVEAMRDGESVTENRRVILQAGDLIEASFRDLSAAKKTRPQGPISVASYQR
jgi:uncharacterized protein (TIGR03000 family)